MNLVACPTLAQATVLVIAAIISVLAGLVIFARTNGGRNMPPI